jgi:hypothetical protein
MVLLASPHILLAQRGTRGGGAMRPSIGASNPAASNSDMNDFNRAIALQASPQQIAQFQQLTNSTAAARKETRDLTQADNTTKLDPSLYASLNDTVEEALNSSLKFVSSFSPAQQSGLKPQIKRLNKTNSDLSKHSKALNQELGSSKIESKKVGSLVGNLDKALLSLQTEQLDIGKEMGIQTAENSQ